MRAKSHLMLGVTKFGNPINPLFGGGTGVETAEADFNAILITGV